MGTDERNFRSSYYEKVGCLGVEKRSLAKLLNDDVRNKQKLEQFCLNYAVPAAQRGLLWGIIMEVFPKHKTAMDYVTEQREQVYKDLHRAASIMRFVEPQTTKEQLLYTLWLLENNRILNQNNTGEPANCFMEILRVLVKIFESDVEIYWLSKGFYKYVQDIQAEKASLKEFANVLLKKEHVKLHSFLEDLGVFKVDCDVLDNLFATCFAPLIVPTHLIQIWDKVCGGSRKILVFLFNEVIKSAQKSILGCKSTSELRDIMSTTSDHEVIVSKAIRTWQNNKSHTEIEYVR